MESKAVNSLIFIILILVVALTLTPLFIMFRTSVRAQGSLTKTIDEIKVTDFKEGLVSAFRTPIRRGGEKEQIEIKTITLNGRGILEADILSKVKESILWQAQINQDVRKFKSLSLEIKYPSSFIDTTVLLIDSFGKTASVSLSKYIDEKDRDFQKIEIPISDFDLTKVKPQRIESLALKISDAKKTKIYFADVFFKLKKITFINYIDVLVSGPFGRYFFNSCLVALVVTCGNLIFSSMVGYCFARKEFPFKQSLFLLIVGSIMIPPQVLMVPMFILMKNLRWLNTYWALTIPSLVLPFNIFLMRQYISNLPLDVEDAALVDGANTFQILLKVIMPLARPALAVVGINTFMGAWNTFLYPFLLTNTTHMRTLPVGLALYKSLYSVDWVHLMAASSITAIPVIIVFLAFQRHIIASLTAGATKG